MNRSLVIAVALGATLSLPARAEYPDRPIQLIVPFPAGGVVDVIGRRFAEALSGSLKQPVVVMNRDGASGLIGMEAVANAAPDGHTLAFAPNGPLTIQPSLRPVRHDLSAFRPICQVSVITYVVAVRPDSPIQSLGQIVELAKSPAGAKFAIGGVGTLPHFAVLQLGIGGGVKFLTVPYRGDPGVTLALKSGDVDGGILGVDSAVAQGFKVLAVFSAKRLSFLPEAPTAREQGFDVVASSNAGMYAGKDVSADVARRLESACAEITRSASFQSAMIQLKQEPAYLPGAAFAELLAADASEKKRLVEATGIKQDQ